LDQCRERWNWNKRFLGETVASLESFLLVQNNVTIDIQSRADPVYRMDFAAKPVDWAYGPVPNKAEDNFLATLLRWRAFLNGILGDAEPHVAEYPGREVQVIQSGNRGSHLMNVHSPRAAMLNLRVVVFNLTKFGIRNGWCRD
jgi:hypothetical protein